MGIGGLTTSPRLRSASKTGSNVPPSLCQAFGTGKRPLLPARFLNNSFGICLSFMKKSPIENPIDQPNREVGALENEEANIILIEDSSSKSEAVFI